MAKLQVTDIQWDLSTDEDDEFSDSDSLPESYVLEYDEEEFVDDDSLSDWICETLSDMFGWCITGLNYERIEDEDNEE
jgi:hypothetical protein